MLCSITDGDGPGNPVWVMGGLPVVSNEVTSVSLIARRGCFRLEAAVVGDGSANLQAEYDYSRYTYKDGYQSTRRENESKLDSKRIEGATLFAWEQKRNELDTSG